MPIEDIQQPNKLLVVVEAIKLAREVGDLQLEEELYNEVIDIYQSSETLKKFTTPDPKKPEELKYSARYYPPEWV